jgi:hypothetical protein
MGTQTLGRWLTPSGQSTFYHAGTPLMYRWVFMKNLVHYNRDNGSKFFDPDTLAWFGVVSQVLYRGVLIERHAKAPGAKYAVTWFDYDGQPIVTERHRLLASARRAAEAPDFIPEED